MKKTIRNGFVLGCVLLLIGILGYGIVASIRTSDGKNEEETKLVERTAADDEVTTVEEAAAGGPAIPDDPAPDYVGFVDVGFRIGNGENQRTVKLYLNGKEGYVFLPSYAKLSKLAAEFDEQAFSVSIDGRGIGSGETIADIRADETYDMSITVKAGNAADGGVEAQDGKKTNAVLAVMQGGDAVAETETPQVKTYDMYELTFMKSANLPALYIDTADGTMDYLNQDKANEEPGDMLCLTENGELDSYGAIRKIHGRGNYSWNASQKGYTFHTQNAVDLLGMGEATKWKITANAYDPTKIRNALALSLAKDIGMKYAVDYEFVDVWLNGEYNGNYMLNEAIEVAPNRVELTDGDYLLEVTNDMMAGMVYFSWDYGLPCDILFPKDASRDQIKEMRHQMDDVFHRLKECRTKKRYNRLKEEIDIDSFAKMYLVNMVTNEPDSNAASTFYYSKEDKIYSGPAWDFDHGLNNLIVRYGVCPEFNTYSNGPSEWLMDSQEYRGIVCGIYDEHEQAIENVKRNVDILGEKICRSILMSKILYPLSPLPDSDFGDYEENIDFLREMVNCRTQLLEDTVHNPNNYCRISILDRWYWLKKGELLPEDFLENICKLWQWDYLAYANGTRLIPDRPITTDLVLTGVPIETTPTETPANETTPTDSSITDTTTTPQEKGDFIMTLLGILLLITPGVISLLVSGDYTIRERGDIPALVGHYLMFEFLTIMLSYGVITMLKGSVTISLSGITHGETYTIFHSNVVFLLSTLFLTISVTLGIFARLFKQGERFLKHMKDAG